MKRAASVTFLLLCIAISVAGAINVFADNADVRASAKDVACKKKKCGPGGPALTREDRTPIAQSFLYATSDGTVAVRCARAAILVGDYSCAAD
jgi:hypothetical protein